MTRFRTRFSLRALVILVTGCAFLFGWISLPTSRVHRLLLAIKGGDYRRAESMFRYPGDAYPGNLVTDAQARLSTLELFPLTIEQLVRGERWVHIYAPYDPDMDVRSFDYNVNIRVTCWDVTTTALWH